MLCLPSGNKQSLSNPPQRNLLAFSLVITISARRRAAADCLLLHAIPRWFAKLARSGCEVRNSGSGFREAGTKTWEGDGGCHGTTAKIKAKQNKREQPHRADKLSEEKKKKKKKKIISELWIKVSVAAQRIAPEQSLPR